MGSGEPPAAWVSWVFVQLRQNDMAAKRCHCAELPAGDPAVYLSLTLHMSDQVGLGEIAVSVQCGHKQMSHEGFGSLGRRLPRQGPRCSLCSPRCSRATAPSESCTGWRLEAASLFWDSPDPAAVRAQPFAARWSSPSLRGPPGGDLSLCLRATQRCPAIV